MNESECKFNDNIRKKISEVEIWANEENDIKNIEIAITMLEKTLKILHSKYNKKDNFEQANSYIQNCSLVDTENSENSVETKDFANCDEHSSSALRLTSELNIFEQADSDSSLVDTKNSDHFNDNSLVDTENSDHFNDIVIINHVEGKDYNPVETKDFDKCDEQGSSALCLTSVLNNITKKERHKCNICLKFFTTKFSLQRHVSNKHAENKEKFKCSICAKTFRFSKHLETHKEKEHSNFHQSSNITICWHQPIPEKKLEYNFPCSQCEQLFPNSLALEAHKKEHTQTKTYKCDKCNKIYQSFSGLYSHRHAAHNHLLWNCKLCSAHFR